MRNRFFAYREFLVAIQIPDRFFFHNFAGADCAHVLIPRLGRLPLAIRIAILALSVRVDQIWANSPLCFQDALGFPQWFIDTRDIKGCFRLLHIRAQRLRLFDLAVR
jgi:hypothetical protein